MITLSIDLETYCELSIKKVGLYRYVEHPSFEIVLFAYAFDDDPVQIIDLLDFEDIPLDVVTAMTDPDVIKTAWNTPFERTALDKYFGCYMPPEQWRDSMIHAYYLGLPGSLDKAGEVLKVEAQKDNAGKALIRYFSIPCKPTKTNGGRKRNLPEHDIEKWERFKVYCQGDVEAEREIRKRLEKHPVPESEWKLWELDQQINDRGVSLATKLVDNAIDCDKAYQNRLTEELKRITGLDNPNSLEQLKTWLSTELGYTIDSLTKDSIPKLLDEINTPNVKKVLELRQEASKTSIKKFYTAKNVNCSDDRVRGLLQFYGANRTGRWAGRLIQLQNLPRNYLKDLKLARQLLLEGGYDTLEMLEMLFGNVPDTLSQLIRTILIPSEGCRFIVSDFSAIEARVLAWLAGEQWVLDVFKTHGKIYEATAAQMFKVPIGEISKGSELRQKGKVAALALGYQGAVGALKSMDKEGKIAEDELQPLVDSWRIANPKIVRFWHDLNNAAIRAVEDKTSVTIAAYQNIRFSYESGGLFIQLPSGRRLCYAKPHMATNRFGSPSLGYWGVEQGKWSRLETYGGKLAENITQAVARDCLAESLVRIHEAGNKIAFHVHDEIVLDAPKELSSIEQITDIMGQPIDWAPGLPLTAAGFETEFYMKD